MSGYWEHFPHGADIGIRGVGGSPAEAFAEAARAVVAASVDPATVGVAASIDICCTGADLEDLFYAWLNAVIWEMSVRRMLFCKFDVAIDGFTLHAAAYGEPVSPGRHEPAVEVKGATFTGLSVRTEGDHWIAECVIDV
jgi:tRNA nucleotidyltransferase (CCA-adding enzyme)